MSSLGFLSLFAALTLGVFAFGVEASGVWTCEKTAFVALLSVAIASFVGSMVQRPSLMWQVLDELQRKSFQNPSQQPTHGTNGEHHD